MSESDSMPPAMNRVLVTGANGFVGSTLVDRLAGEGRYAIRGSVRIAAEDDRRAGVELHTVGDIGPSTRWRDALDGVDAIVHLAARVHMMREEATDPLAAFRLVNVDGTIALARQAVEAGVRRFVFISSLKVHGEIGVFRESDVAAPQDAYAVSKHEAEMALKRLAADSGMAVTIVRPPLVYGPGVKANFRALALAVHKGLPLPFAAIDNRRSLVAVDNLVDMIVTCLWHPAAENQTFLVSDGEDLSTPELIRRLASAMNGRARLFAVPSVLLTTAAGLIGRGEVIQRLLSSLQADVGKARALLGWRPRISVDEGLARAVVAICRHEKTENRHP